MFSFNPEIKTCFEFESSSSTTSAQSQVSGIPSIFIPFLEFT